MPGERECVFQNWGTEDLQQQLYRVESLAQSMDKSVPLSV